MLVPKERKPSKPTDESQKLSNDRDYFRKNGEALSMTVWGWSWRCGGKKESLTPSSALLRSFITLTLTLVGCD